MTQDKELYKKLNEAEAMVTTMRKEIREASISNGQATELQENECPPATQDIQLNLKNRQNAIDNVGYGPLNPAEPNEAFWDDKAERWDITPEEAKTALCGNCVFFIRTPSMLECIEEGIGLGEEEAEGSIVAGELGYCNALDFKCASERTCNAWAAGGPVTEEAEMQSIDRINEATLAADDNPCWDGYKQVGMKKGKGGKMVPNCVPATASIKEFESRRAAPAGYHYMPDGTLMRDSEHSTDSELAKKKTGASTPAPKKDRISGSKKNPKGSAAGGKKITFDAKTEKAIENKVEKHNKTANKGRRATARMLKAVYRRGAGAYSTSHRAGQTRGGWAMARVNAFLKLLRSGKPSKAAYTQDNDLLPAAHPKSTKKSASAMLASGLIPEEQALADALVEVVAEYGKFDQDGDGVWAGYTPAYDNEDASIGVKCANCVFYQGGDQCGIITLEVEPEGKCRFAVLPEGAVKGDQIPLRDEESLDLLLASADASRELNASLKDPSQYNSIEETIIALTEASGLGYDAEFAIKAAWMRAVRDGDNPFERARALALSPATSEDLELLPVDMEVS